MEPREIIRYTPEEIVKQTECPACGVDMTKMKKPFSHARKCFSIRRRGPLYRIFGYEECRCGLLIHDGSKAQKLHVCVGRIPPYDPDQVTQYFPESAPSPSPTKRKSIQIQDRKFLQPQRKIWVRNFTSPIQQKSEDIQLVKLPDVCKPKPKSVPRVRNFDMRSTAPSDDVSVYSIIRQDNSISIAGGVVIGVNHKTKENIVIRKRLRLPAFSNS